MKRRALWWATATALTLTLTGCSATTQYEGASPSFRAVSGYQDPKYSYVGMNFNFAVNPPPSYHRPQDDAPFVATASIAD